MAATATQSRWTMSLPTSVMSLFSAADDRANAPEDSNDAPSPLADAAISKHLFFSSPLPENAASGPPSPARSDGSIMFAEPDRQSNSSEDASREGSVISKDAKRFSKKSARPKTCYSICHPPPSSNARQKLHRRPRSLLQLHRLSPNARPVPALEVIPSANFSVRLTRCVTKVFKAKHGLCPHDLVVLRAEKYRTEDQDDEEDERDVVALICKGRKDDGCAGSKMKVCMKDGGEWEAYSLPNGGYELFSTDEHGLRLTVRWVPKKPKDGKKGAEKRFNFSTISANSRRHPVIASLSKSGIDINDTYIIPSQTAQTPLSTPNLKPVDDANEPEEDMKEQIETDDRLRTLITVTGLWVVFKEGWSPTFKYDDNGPSRSHSMQNSPTKSGTLATPPGSPVLGDVQKRSSIRSVSEKIMGSGSRFRNNRLSVASSNSTTSVGSTEQAPSQNGNTIKGRTRADSASTVLVHRAASNRRKNNHQATWRPDLLSAQHPLNETSREDLTRNTPSSQPSPNPSRKPSREPPSLERNQLVVAKPPIAISHNSSNPAVPPLPAPHQPMSPEKRDSTTTNSTDDARNAAGKSQKKNGGWRGLLCGMAS